MPQVSRQKELIKIKAAIIETKTIQRINETKG
jgi:hypothetical protein